MDTAPFCRNGVVTLVIAASLAMSWGPAYGMQPYEDPAFEIVAQGANQCGPTSFYMVFNHFDAHQVFQEVDLSEHPEDMAIYGFSITRDTKICTWINAGALTGTSWSTLRSAAEKLHAPGASASYFITELNATTTYANTKGIAERDARLHYIWRQYLMKDRAVIIHMRRQWYQAGHYLVLTGYDQATDTVYYADPNHGCAGEISRSSFIRDNWYVSPSNTAANYRARWDGEWMAFTPRNSSAFPASLLAFESASTACSRAWLNSSGRSIIRKWSAPLITTASNDSM